MFIETALFLAIKFAIGTLALVVVFMITYNEIINWMRDREGIKQSDRENIAFSLNQKLQNNQYETVYGIFNRRTMY
jgi:ABC-type branched-subunit amino acid transport system permease subunit